MFFSFIYSYFRSKYRALDPELGSLISCLRATWNLPHSQRNANSFGSVKVPNCHVPFCTHWYNPINLESNQVTAVTAAGLFRYAFFLSLLHLLCVQQYPTLACNQRGYSYRWHWKTSCQSLSLFMCLWFICGTYSIVVFWPKLKDSGKKNLNVNLTLTLIYPL